jgi:hypothetical protein
MTRAGKPQLVCWLALGMAFGVAAPIARAQTPVAISATPQQMAEYRKKLLEYTAIRRAFDDEAEAYWNSITEKRKAQAPQQ